ncbi:hypothetical protein [Pararhodobacter sp.]|uniref:hypothetical protein n=1 Tax=Pararhodobacter sp. TaxID=2127056 RepID=UPI002B000942|nr:hypothetical protein [Pararhodobacter sp.]
MGKHPLDHGRAPSTARLDRFVDVERATRPSNAAKTLQQRPRKTEASRLERFAKIERGAEE